MNTISILKNSADMQSPIERVVQPRSVIQSRSTSTDRAVEKPNSRKKMLAQGFTLIEVMVSIFVLTVGILGMAGMQAVSVRESQNTYFRMQADMLAADMADRMRANREDAADAASVNYVSDGTANAATDCLGTVANCSAAQLAGYDVSQWLAQIDNSSIPGGVGTISRNAGTSQYTIQVFWDEDRNGSVATVANCVATAADGCIRLVIEI